MNVVTIKHEIAAFKALVSRGYGETTIYEYLSSNIFHVEGKHSDDEIVNTIVELVLKWITEDKKRITSFLGKNETS
jgi:hypothetical protein